MGKEGGAILTSKIYTENFTSYAILLEFLEQNATAWEA